jgi:hypothetical protein
MFCHGTSEKLHIVQAAQAWDRWPAYPLKHYLLGSAFPGALVITDNHNLISLSDLSSPVVW